MSKRYERLDASLYKTLGVLHVSDFVRRDADPLVLHFEHSLQGVVSVKRVLHVLVLHPDSTRRLES